MKNIYLYLTGGGIVLMLLAGLVWMQVTESKANILNDKYYIKVYNCRPIIKDTSNQNSLLEEFKSMLKATNIKSKGRFLTPILKVRSAENTFLSFGIPVYGLNYIRYLTNADMFTIEDRKTDEVEFFENEYNSNSTFQSVKSVLMSSGSEVHDLKDVFAQSNSFIVNPSLNASVKSKKEFSSFKLLRVTIDSLINAGEINRNDEVSVYYTCGEQPVLKSQEVDILPDSIKMPELIESKPRGVESIPACQDSDKDGICDTEDSCPNLRGVQELNGCPEIIIKHNNESGMFEVTDIPGAVTKLTIQELDYGTGEVTRTITHTCLDLSCPTNKDEANKIFKLLKEISRLRVTVSVEYNEIELAEKIYNNLSYVCMSNTVCGFIKVN
jgi:hypothetical protein